VLIILNAHHEVHEVHEENYNKFGFIKSSCPS